MSDVVEHPEFDLKINPTNNFTLFPIFLFCLSYLLIYKKTRKFDSG